MKDNIILDGKNYISAKRSASVTGYTTDYVGQLCRAGKLDCRMIGHTWYVSEKSLFKHRTDTAGVGRDSKSSPSFEEADEKFISTNEARIISGYSSDYIGQLCRAGKLNCRRVGRAWFVTHKSLIEHKSASEIKVKAEAAEPSIILSAEVAEVAPAVPTVTAATIPEISRSVYEQPLLTTSSIKSVRLDPTLYVAAPIPSPRKVVSHRHYARTALVLSFVCLIIIVGMNIFGRSITSSVRQLASNTSMLSSVGQSGLNGIAVAPSTNSVAGDEALKQQLRDSFTDKVNIQPDQNGTAGVITPVFKKTSDGSFVYVLVPVSDTSKAGTQ